MYVLRDQRQWRVLRGDDDDDDNDNDDDDVCYDDACDDDHVDDGDDDTCDDDVIHNVSQTRSILQFIHLELRWRTGRDLR